MDLYLIERNDYDWDEYASAVVAASSPGEARGIAARDCHSNGQPSMAWNPSNARIQRIGTYTGPLRRPAAIHSHFHAG